jgi:hypothetical protein
MSLSELLLSSEPESGGVLRPDPDDDDV